MPVVSQGDSRQVGTGSSYETPQTFSVPIHRTGDPMRGKVVALRGDSGARCRPGIVIRAPHTDACRPARERHGAAT